MQSKTYDSVTEKYLDFSFEKTNSAYMLFYERCLPEHIKKQQNAQSESIISKRGISINHDEKKNVDSMAKENAVKLNKKEENDKITNAKEKQKNTKKSDEEKSKDDDNATKWEKKTITNQNSKNEMQKTSFDDIEMNCHNDFISIPSTSTAGGLLATNQRMKNSEDVVSSELIAYSRPKLSKELEDWIWQDNRQFLQDRNIFEHTYFK